MTVNKATQRMTVLVDGETRYSWPVSTGMKGRGRAAWALYTPKPA